MLDKVIIGKSSLSGTVAVPPSKSQTMRALIFALLAQGKSHISNLLPSPDTQAMVSACRLLGAKIHCFGNRIEVIGGLQSAHGVIDAGNSGQVLRFLGAVSALLPTYTVITGDDSIKLRRPIRPLLEGLNQLGAWGVSMQGNDQAPLIVRGPIQGGYAEISGEDSQPISALLMAASFARGATEIRVENPGETPWIGLTLSWLDRFHLPYENHDFKHYKLPGNASISGFDYTIPGDWSSALYPIAAALITSSELTITGVDIDDAQGDKHVISLLQQMGAHISIDRENRAVTVHKDSSLKGAKVDIGRFIDAITILPVLACYAQGTTEIVGGSIARLKECDRIRAIVTELKKMGANIEENPDGVVVEPSPLKGASLFCYSDHRMALALSVAAMGAEGSTELIGAEAIDKSFPDYLKQLSLAGAKIE